ncbi:hypothetical protein GCM10022243_05630 [Saccharothrix violaceirubra]|uniref:Uncharacterized protein n=1 Tax=Saccharothrix violaceirubra TaxID=413306 RepID=A0A7W7WTZ4_9PSEU|nr:hypothetical protein [Saccharothrix violaceirubra]MBB4962973.1 hypothetical protein [Saccharothrix violaceirubra]
MTTILPSSTSTAFRATVGAIFAHHLAATAHAVEIGCTDGDREGRHVDPAGPYPLPSTSTLDSVPRLPGVRLDDGEADSRMRVLLASLEETVQCVRHDVQVRAQDVANRYHHDQDAHAFRIDVEELKAFAKAGVDQALERWFASVSDLGDRFPLARDRVLVTTQRVGGLVTAFVIGFVNFATDLANTVPDRGARAYEKVTDYFETVSSGLRHAFRGLR